AAPGAQVAGQHREQPAQPVPGDLLPAVGHAAQQDEIYPHRPRLGTPRPYQVAPRMRQLHEPAAGTTLARMPAAPVAAIQPRPSPPSYRRLAVVVPARAVLRPPARSCGS